MSTRLRVLLLVSALLTACWIVYKIRKLKVKMEDAIFWVIFAGVLLVFGLFPQVAYWMSDLFGVLSPSNLIFLIIIFLLLEKVFSLSMLVSQLEEKVSMLASEMALRDHVSSVRLNALEKAEEIKP